MTAFSLLRASLIAVLPAKLIMSKTTTLAVPTFPRMLRIEQHLASVVGMRIFGWSDAQRFS